MWTYALLLVARAGVARAVVRGNGAALSEQVVDGAAATRAASGDTFCEVFAGGTCFPRRDGCNLWKQVTVQGVEPGHECSVEATKVSGGGFHVAQNNVEPGSMVCCVSPPGTPIVRAKPDSDRVVPADEGYREGFLRFLAGEKEPAPQPHRRTPEPAKTEPGTWSNPANEFDWWNFD